MKYQIQGEPLPVVICQLENGESMICEGGSMSWMSSNMSFETSGGGAGRMFGRLISGESMFQNRYTAQGGPGMIAFASSFPGAILPYEITPDHPIIVQKRSFLASTAGVTMSTYLQKSFGKGMFGGEGFIMQKLEGNGTVFIEVDGSTVQYELQAGQSLVVDSGYLAMMDATVQMDIQRIKGAKNVLLGGEGLFNAIVTGPGRIVLQTMPLYRFANLISSMMPSKN